MMISEPLWVLLVQKWSYILYYVKHVIEKYDLNGYVLDVGCGRRGWLSLLVKSYFDSVVITFDIIPEKVRDAKKISELINRRSEGYIVASAYDLPLRNGVFDKIIGNAVLHHLLDRIDDLGSEFYRVGKKSCDCIFVGEIVASSLIGWIWKKIVLEKIPGEGISTKKNWISVFENAGFKNIQILKEVRYGYFDKSILRNIYYYVIKHIPDSIVINMMITSATIVFEK